MRGRSSIIRLMEARKYGPIAHLDSVVRGMRMRSGRRPKIESDDKRLTVTLPGLKVVAVASASRGRKDQTVAISATFDRNAGPENSPLANLLQKIRDVTLSASHSGAPWTGREARKLKNDEIVEPEWSPLKATVLAGAQAASTLSDVLTRYDVGMSTAQSLHGRSSQAFGGRDVSAAAEKEMLAAGQRQFRVLSPSGLPPSESTVWSVVRNMLELGRGDKHDIPIEALIRWAEDTVPSWWEDMSGGPIPGNFASTLRDVLRSMREWHASESRSNVLDESRRDLFESLNDLRGLVEASRRKVSPEKQIRRQIERAMSKVAVARARLGLPRSATDKYIARVWELLSGDRVMDVKALADAIEAMMAATRVALKQYQNDPKHARADAWDEMQSACGAAAYVMRSIRADLRDASA